MLRYFLRLFCSLFIPSVRKHRIINMLTKAWPEQYYYGSHYMEDYYRKQKSGLSSKQFTATYSILFLMQNSVKTQIMWRWWRPRWRLTPCLRWIKVWNIVPRTIYASTVLTSTPTGMLAFRSGRGGTECALLKQTQQRPDRCLFFLKFLSK